MIVSITRTTEGYKINGKSVYQNSDGNWITPIELSNIEKQEFNSYLNSF